MIEDLTEDILLTVGRNIKTRRKKIGFKRNRLAEFINVSDRTMQQYEDGQSYINIVQLFYIAQALKMNINALYHTVDDQDLPHFINKHFKQN